VNSCRLPVLAVACVISIVPIVGNGSNLNNWRVMRSPRLNLACVHGSLLIYVAMLLAALLGLYVPSAIADEPVESVADSSPVRSIITVRDDAALVALAATRPQPKDQPAPKLGAEESLLQSAGITRPWAMSVSAWEAPAFCHRPLYFEDENLERHGRSYGLVQPAVSAGHFAGRLVAWPYLAGAFPPHECIYTLGRERPGSCAPYRLYRPPVSVHGAIYEAAAITGLSFVVP
jgi:hypothetical protein